MEVDSRVHLHLLLLEQNGKSDTRITFSISEDEEMKKEEEMLTNYYYYNVIAYSPRVVHDNNLSVD